MSDDEADFLLHALLPAASAAVAPGGELAVMAARTATRNGSRVTSFVSNSLP